MFLLKETTTHPTVPSRKLQGHQRPQEQELPFETLMFTETTICSAQCQHTQHSQQTCAVCLHCRSTYATVWKHKTQEKHNDQRYLLPRTLPCCYTGNKNQGNSGRVGSLRKRRNPDQMYTKFREGEDNRFQMPAPLRFFLSWIKVFTRKGTKTAHITH